MATLAKIANSIATTIAVLLSSGLVAGDDARGVVKAGGDEFVFDGVDGVGGDAQTGSGGSICEISLCRGASGSGDGGDGDGDNNGTGGGQGAGGGCDGRDASRCGNAPFSTREVSRKLQGLPLGHLFKCGITATRESAPSYTRL